MSISKTPYGVTFVATLMASWGTPAVLHAAEERTVKQLEEIVVTAQRREESLQDVPVSVGVVTGQQIKEYSIQNLDQLSQYVPGFEVHEGGEQTSISIRGFSTGINFGFDQSVGMFVDGVYAGRERQFRDVLLDVSSVEVLYGPQATLFGKSTTAGAVIISTGKPTHEFNTELGVEYTPLTLSQNYRTIVNAPIGDSLAVRLAAKLTKSGGYFRNTFTGEREVQENDWIIRSSALWEPMQGLSIFGKYEHSKTFQVGRALGIRNVQGLQTNQPLCLNEVPRAPLCQATTADVDITSRLSTYKTYDPNFVWHDYEQKSNQRETSSYDADNAVLRIEYNLADNMKLSSITGYSAFKSDDQRDVDWSPSNYLFEPITEHFSQYSQEFQLTSKVNEKFDYIAGVHAYKNDFYVDRRTDIDINVFLLPFGARPFDPLPFGGPAAAWQYANLRYLDQATKSTSAYLSGTYNFTPELHLNAGARWNRQTKNATDRVALAQFGTTRFLDVRLDPADQLNDPNYLIANALNPCLTNGALLGTAADIALVQNVRNASTGTRDAINLVLGPCTTRFGGEQELTETDVSPEAKLSWNINDDAMIYARYAHAEKGGGFNSATTGANATNRTFDAEKINAYEVGAKLKFFDRTVSLNFGLFIQQLLNQQNAIWTGTDWFVGNAGESRARGLQGDAAWQATNHLRFNASFLWMDGKYIDFTNVACTLAQRQYTNPNEPGCVRTPASGPAVPPAVVVTYTRDLSGQHYLTKPSGTLGASYDFALPNDMSLVWNATAVYTPRGESWFYTNFGSRTIVTTGLQLNSGDGIWDVGVLVRNATNKRYYSGGGWEAPSQIGTQLGWMTLPRTYTFQATYHIK